MTTPHFAIDTCIPVYHFVSCLGRVQLQSYFFTLLYKTRLHITSVSIQFRNILLRFPKSAVFHDIYLAKSITVLSRRSEYQNYIKETKLSVAARMSP